MHKSATRTLPFAPFPCTRYACMQARGVLPMHTFITKLIRKRVSALPPVGSGCRAAPLVFFKPAEPSSSPHRI